MRCRRTPAAWLFLLLSILILIVMGSILEGAAALIIFGPLLIPVAGQIGINELHFGVVLVIAMGIGLFAPPLGLGLYGACLIGGVPIETTVRPMLGYLGLLLSVPVGDRVRPGSDALASASARLSVGAGGALGIEVPERPRRTSTALHNPVVGVRLDRAPS